METKIPSPLSTLSVAAFAIIAVLMTELKLESGEPTPASQTNQTEQSSPNNTNEYKPSTSGADASACKRNLEKIKEAIEAYRKDNKDIPNWLSDLVPKYLADTNVLICPVTVQTGRLSPFGVLDPKVRSSYLYEFTPTLIPDVVKGAWPGPKRTMRDWKRQQMGVLGSEVPIVRCLLHEPALNLSFGGTVYESEVLWEDNFKDVADRAALSPH